MIIINHRCNSIRELSATPTRYGLEIDLRSLNGQIVLSHEPYVPGETFQDWLRGYNHGLIVLNVKEDGLEEEILRLLTSRGVAEYFFIEQSFASMLRTIRSGERRCAVRFSEYESIHTALAMAPLLDWVWVDAFSKVPLGLGEWSELKARGLKVALVSPELIHASRRPDIQALKMKFQKDGIVLDAVCTDFPQEWEL